MSKKKETESKEARTDLALSRRSFLRGGTAGALSAGLLSGEAAGASSNDTSASAEPLGPGAVTVELQVNGQARELVVEPRVTLLDALRDRLRVTGPKRVCDRATCGACTVLQDGELIYACTRLAVECEGADIVTVEGLGDPDAMHPVQAAFVEHDAQQCGFCTPGFVMATSVLLEVSPNPTEAEIEAALGGNLCRCGTYGGMRKVLASGLVSGGGGSA